MIHSLADVQSENIGEGTKVWQFCVILKGAVIGKECNVNCHVFIENDVVIGDYVTIKPGVQVWDGLRIKDKAFIGPNVTFTNDLIPRSQKPPEEFIKTYIEEGASIGANTTVIAGVTIGNYAMIGAGSLVNKDVPPFSLWFGNPAKHKGFVTRKGDILTPQLKDKEGNKYKIKGVEPIKITNG